MKCQSDIEKLADLKLQAANCLLENKLFDDAYYIAGYAIELNLKAKVCKTLKVDDFFAFNKTVGKDLYRPYKVHNYQELLLLSGLYPDFENQLNDTTFKLTWSIVSTWKEESRYLTGKTEQETIDFITSVKEFVTWIQKHL